MARVHQSWVLLFPQVVRLWLITFFWGQTLKQNALAYFKSSSFSPPPAENARGLFLGIHWDTGRDSHGKTKAVPSPSLHFTWLGSPGVLTDFSTHWTSSNLSIAVIALVCCGFLYLLVGLILRDSGLHFDLTSFMDLGRVVCSAFYLLLVQSGNF